MSLQKLAWEGLEKLQAFPTFATQDAAAAAGAPGAKDYVSTQDERNHFDPNPAEPADYKIHFYVGSVLWVMYRFVFGGKLDPDQNGILVSLAMPAEQAGKVNIKPSGTGMTNVPGTGKVMPVPLKRDLLPTEKIRRQTAFSNFQIRNLDVALPSEVAASTVDSMAKTVQDLLTGLAEVQLKLGKIMAKLGVV